MTSKVIKSGLAGDVGILHEIDLKPDTVLIFQLPRETKMLSQVYVEGALNAVRSSIPEGRQAIVIGADVNIYEIAGEDAVALKLKGILL
jgi:hypothetical protein